MREIVSGSGHVWLLGIKLFTSASLHVSCGYMQILCCQGHNVSHSQMIGYNCWLLQLVQTLEVLVANMDYQLAVATKGVRSYSLHIAIILYIH